MPNHCYNTLTIHAQTKAELDNFIADVSRPFEAQERDWTTGETKMIRVEPEFSYNNIVPFPTEPNTYWDYKDEDGKLHQNWYNWNLENWDTKWDAYDVSIDRYAEKAVTYSFTSAWAPPIKVIQALCLKYPQLSVNFYYEEEQGWGGEMDSSAGDSYLTQVSEWDIPNSHADYVALDRECHCQSDDDQTYWFDDCPRQEIGDDHTCNCGNCVGSKRKETVNG